AASATRASPLWAPPQTGAGRPSGPPPGPAARARAAAPRQRRRAMKFGLRYASLGKYSNGPAAVELAQAAEEAGFDSIWTVEHVVVPRDYQSKYPYSPSGRMGSGLEDFPIPDPLVWLPSIPPPTPPPKLGTAILILPQRNPVVTAKAIATLDHLAGGGRVLLGIGVGWLAEEFSTLGVPFADRGPRTDEYVAAMRTLWRDECASIHGRFV